jgi:hypothetical protein
VAESPGQAAGRRPRGLIEAMAIAMWEKYGVHRADSIWKHPLWNSFDPDDAEKAKWRGYADEAFNVVEPILNGWKTEVDALNGRIAELESAATPGDPREHMNGEGRPTS